MTKMYEFIVEDQITKEQTSVFYSGDCSLSYVALAEGMNGMDLDEEATLSNYMDPKIIENYRVEIINDNDIYSNYGISDLVNEYGLFYLLNEKFDAEINEKGMK